MPNFIEVKDFNEIIKYFEIFILTTLRKDIKSINNFQMKCNSTNIDYLLSLDIDRNIKMKQLRTMYLNEDEINRVRDALITDTTNSLQVSYNFNTVGGKDISTHHKKGGCLKKVTFNLVRDKEVNIIIQFRASVAPYNLYYDLIMLHDLFNELKIDVIKELKNFYFEFEEVKGKLMQNFFYYISAGYYDNPENLLKYDYGRMMLDEYNKAENASYHSTKRFWGKCNDAMERRNLIGK